MEEASGVCFDGNGNGENMFDYNSWMGGDETVASNPDIELDGDDPHDDTYESCSNDALDTTNPW